MTDAPTPREVLTGGDAALKLLVGKTPGQADWLRPVTVTDVERALTRREPLDVERLARAIAEIGSWKHRTDHAFEWYGRADEMAEEVAAEYARLEAADKT